MDLNYIGQPNVNAKGIVNDAFDELDKDKETKIMDESLDDKELIKKLSVDISEVVIDNIQPSSLRELVTNTVDDISENADIEAKEDGKDPFDTSGFDSEAFEAFESRFESTDIDNKKSKNKDDPFASPFKSNVAVDSTKNEFDSFEPFVPKQPENTPYKMPKKPKKKKDSFEDSDSDFDDDDDDEPEETFRIVIRAKTKDTNQSNQNTNLGNFC